MSWTRSCGRGGSGSDDATAPTPIRLETVAGEYEALKRELEAWRQSGESMAAFARSRGYLPKRLEYWRRLESEAQPPERATTGLAPAVITGLNRPPVVVTVNRDGVRLEIDYLKAELELKRRGVEHTIVVFGGTRVREPAGPEELEPLGALHIAYRDQTRSFRYTVTGDGIPLLADIAAPDNIYELPPEEAAKVKAPLLVQLAAEHGLAPEHALRDTGIATATLLRIWGGPS